MDSKEFDNYAQNYEDLLKQGMVLKGSDHAYFEEYKIRYLKKYLFNSKKMLDYGCGIGKLDETISKHFSDLSIHGFDISPISIEAVSSKLKENKKNRFVFSKDELDCDYDNVLLVTMLHHVEIDKREEVLKDAWNKVKLGGNLIIIEHNMMNPLTKKSVKTSPLDVNAHMLSNKECKKLVSILDAPIKSSYIVFWPKQLRFMQFADKMLEWIPLGAQYMVVVKKTK